MKLDMMNMMFSVPFLQQRRLPRDKVIAASMGAGLVGGPMGLLLPVMAAGGSTATTTTTTGVTVGAPPPAGSTVKVAVPNVVRQPLEKAVKQITDARLHPVTSVYHTDKVDDHGRVLQQDPNSDRLVPVESEVDLTIGAAPLEEELSESEKEDKILKVVEGTAAKVDALLARRKEPNEASS